jgi:hypothetical protein
VAIERGMSWILEQGRTKEKEFKKKERGNLYKKQRVKVQSGLFPPFPGRLLISACVFD